MPNCHFITKKIEKVLSGYVEDPSYNKLDPEDEQFKPKFRTDYIYEGDAITKTLKTYSPPLCLSQRVITSSRRWEERGILITIWLMWRLRLAYYFGTDPKRLAQRYQ